MIRVLWITLWVLSCSATAFAQLTATERLAVGTSPTVPSGSSVRITNLGTSGGDGVIFTDAEGDMIKRALAKADLPATVGYTDEAETWSLLQTFTSGLTSNGLLTIGGANDLLLGTGGIRAPSGSILLRNIADSANIATFGDAAIALNQPTTQTGNFTVTGGDVIAPEIRAATSPFLIRNAADSATIGSFGDAAIALNQATTVNASATVTGLTTLAKMKTTGIYAVAAPLLFRNAADSATVMSMADVGLNITGTLDVSGLTTLAKVKATHYYGVNNPFTVQATDAATDLMYLYDNGRTVIRNTGNDTMWEYHALGNASGQRIWRAGNIGGSYLIQGCNDGITVCTNIFRTTQTGGVPDGWFWGTGVKDVNPDQNFQTNLGAINRKYANLHAANLWIDTLVAQDTIATIGGNILVGPTTELEVDLAAAGTSITVTHNEMTNGDIVYMMEDGRTEFLQITSNGVGTGGGDSVDFIGSDAVANTSIAMPAHSAGDTLIIIAFRIGSNTPPTATTGSSGGGTWTNLCNGGADSTSHRVAYMTATSNAETSGTWANATHMHVFVLQGVDVVGPGCTAASGTATTTLTYPAMTLADSDGSSYVLRAGISNQGTNDTSVAMTGYTLLEHLNAGGTLRDSSSFLSNTGQTSVTQLDVTLGTSGNTRGLGIELQGTTTPATGPFQYSVSRAYGGVFAARDWYAGDALFNTGQTGDGHIQIYSIQSIKGTGEAGPSIQGNVRTSATYNAWSTYWGLGNLRGMYTYGASDVYGAAFGNAADVWLGVDATNGIRFFEGATTQTAQFALDGTILLGRAGAGEENAYITPTAVKLRRGTVDYAVLDDTGLLLGLTTGSEANTQITTAALKLRRGTTDYVTLDTNGLLLGLTTGSETNAQITTTALKLRRGTTDYVTLSSAGLTMSDGTNTRVTLDATNGLLLGRTTAGHGNTLIDTSGNLSLRSNTTTRIKLAATNGTVSIFDDDGTTERVSIGATVAYFGGTTGARFQYTYSTGTFEGYDSGNVRRLYWDATYGIVVGKPAGAYTSITDSTLSLCAGGGGICTLQLDGTSGNITSTGSILLSTGGSVTSTGNFELSAANGLYLTQHSSSTSDPGTKGVKWASGPTLFTWSNNLVMNAGTTNWVSGGNAVRMTLFPAENVVYDEPAMRITVLSESGSTTWTPLGVDGGVARSASLYPFADDTSDIGTSSLRYKNINLVLPNNTSPTYVVVNKGGAGGDASSALGYIAGFSGTKVAGSCTLTVVVGLITNITGC